MDVYLSTLGCRLNEAELEHWQRELEAGGDRVVSKVEDAQVTVLNTCAVTHLAGRKSRQSIRKLHRKNPTSKLVVTGCYAVLEPEKIAQMEGVDLVVDNLAKEQLVDALREKLDVKSMPRMAEEATDDGSHVYAASRTRAFLKVQDGCRNRCTFCVVTILRGDERSVAVDTVLERVRSMHREGYQEVVLTGVHLGGYGSDIDSSLYELVQRVLAETEVPRVRLTSLEPWDLPEGFFELWRNPRLQPHLHLPLQSGCDATLKRMSRRATVESYRGLVDAARTNVPGLTLTTDLIVGFPGEDEQEWQETLATVESIGFAHMHIFSYSVREGTKAARIPGHVDPQAKKSRSRQLHALAATMKEEHLRSFLGQTRSVLFEGQHEDAQEGRRRFTGYTDNYLRVSVEVSAETTLTNVIAPVVLENTDGQSYQGTLATSL
jgi:threonylcarbamoyladenosine tRNA methylthiotransferase MtaB